MKRKRKALDPRVMLAIAVAAPLLVLGAGWLLLVSPQRSRAADLQAQVATVEQQVAANEAARRIAGNPPPIRVADIFRLATAMPDSVDMPGIILQLNQIAQASGVTFTSFSPHPAAPESGYQSIEIGVSFSGDFYSLSDFLYRLRSLVSVRSGTLDASGRLFSVQSLKFSPRDQSASVIDATLTLDAYVYGTGSTTTTTTSTDTTATTTTSTDTTATTTTPTDTTATTGGLG